MANFNYGNSFNSYEGENVGVERISVWKSVREFFPGGAVLSAEDYSNGSLFPGNFQPIKAGTTIPAGTPIYVDKPGGKPNLNVGGDTYPIGLTYEDVTLGTDGCTFTIVTMGEFLESRYPPTHQGLLDKAFKEHLFGRISFIKEV